MCVSHADDIVQRTNDMLAIFFPHLFEELEYLLPQDALAQGARHLNTLEQVSLSRNDGQNAVAGPSGTHSD